MSRGFSPAVADALAAGHVRLLSFAKLEFSSQTLYVHNGIGEYTFDGQTWQGLGDLATISAVEEGTDVSPYSITLTLSLLDATLAEQALEENYYMRPVTIYLGVLDEDDEFVQEPNPANTQNPVALWAGHMDQMAVSVGSDQGDMITMTCESQLSLLQRSRNLMFTNTWQQSRYSGDKFFNLLAFVEGVKVNWKGKGSTITSGDIDLSQPRGPGNYRN